MSWLPAVAVMIGMASQVENAGPPVLEPAARARQTEPADTEHVEALITAYCPCRECCGPNAKGITSTGVDARRLTGCAVDPKLIPYGSRVRIPGVGWRVADDTGGAMRKNGRRGIVHIDVRMQSHREALEFGVRRKTVVIKRAAEAT